MLEAYFHALLLDRDPFVLLARDYSMPTKPAVPALPKRREIRQAARTIVRSSYSWLQRRGLRGRRLVNCEVERLTNEFGAERARLEARAAEAYSRFQGLDEPVNLVVLQAAFADNGGTAAPISLADAVLTILMSFPEPDQAIWPEAPVRTPAGGASTRRRTKSELAERHWLNLQVHMLATVKEAFCIQPALAFVQIVVVEELPDIPLANLPVRAAGRFPRQPTLDALRWADPGWASAWDRLAQQALDGSNVVPALNGWDRFDEGLLAFVERAFVALRHYWDTPKPPRSKARASSVPSLRDVLDGVDFAEIAGGVDDQHLPRAPIGLVAATPDALVFPQFWDDALAAAEGASHQHASSAGSDGADRRSSNSVPTSKPGADPPVVSPKPSAAVASGAVTTPRESASALRERAWKGTSELEAAVASGDWVQARAAAAAIVEAACQCVRLAGDLPTSWDTAMGGVRTTIIINGAAWAQTELLTTADHPAVTMALGEVISEATKDLALASRIVSTVRDRPGVLQADLGVILGEDPAHLRHLCWILAKYGRLNRERSGRTYRLWDPS